jgi:hypothetical protein
VDATIYDDEMTHNYGHGLMLQIFIPIIVGYYVIKLYDDFRQRRFVMAAWGGLGVVGAAIYTYLAILLLSPGRGT